MRRGGATEYVPYQLRLPSGIRTIKPNLQLCAFALVGIGYGDAGQLDGEMAGEHCCRLHGAIQHHARHHGSPSEMKIPAIDLHRAAAAEPLAVTTCDIAVHVMVDAAEGFLQGSPLRSVEHGHSDPLGAADLPDAAEAAAVDGDLFDILCRREESHQAQRQC